MTSAITPRLLSEKEASQYICMSRSFLRQARMGGIMQKLTPSQSTLLSYFAKGGYVEICTTVCNQLGTTNFPPSKPEQFSKTVLYSLIKEGLLRTTGEQLVFGIRWNRLQITERGLNRHEEVEAQHAPI